VSIVAEEIVGVAMFRGGVESFRRQRWIFMMLSDFSRWSVFFFSAEFAVLHHRGIGGPQDEQCACECGGGAMYGELRRGQLALGSEWY
jgi:hypothetical protein